MKGIGRNLLFWGKTLEKMVLMMVLWIIGIVSFMTLAEGGDFWTELGNQLPSYLIMLTFLTVFMTSMNGIQIYFPLTVSFGSGRKQSFVAMQVIQHVIAAELVAAVSVCSYFFNPQFWWLISSYFMSVLGVLLVFMGMGNLISITYMRFGRTMGVLLYIAILILIIAIGVFGFSMTGKSIGIDFLTQGGINSFLQGPFILLFGILFDAVLIAIFYLGVRKQNLKFVG